MNILAGILVRWGCALVFATTAGAQTSPPAPGAAVPNLASQLSQMAAAVRAGDAAKVKDLLGANPRIAVQQTAGMATVRTWLHTSAELGHTNVVELLIAASVDLNVPGDALNTSGMRRTPLHLAAANGHAGVVRQLLVAGARVDPVDNRGATPLYFSLASQTSFGPPGRNPEARLETIGLLLRNGANVLAPMREYGRTNTPLDLVLAPGRTNWLDVMLTNAQPPTVRDAQGNTMLHLALARGRRTAAETLLRQKADLSATNLAGLTAFQNSVLFGPPQPLDPATGTRMEPPGYWNLLAAGLKPDLFTLTGMGDRAALAQRFAADKSPAKMARDGGGRTLLHWAAAKGYAEVVELLLEHGADPAVTDAQGRLPLHEAAQFGRAEILPRLAARELAGREDSSRRTAFEFAVQHAQPVAAEWLLRFKPDLTRTNADGQSPLHLVIVQGNTDLAAQLLVAGASPAAMNRNGQTPLHLAAERGNTNALIKLLNARAPVTLRDRAGVTALVAALNARHTEAARLLLDAAADGWERTASVDSLDDEGHTPLTRAIARRDQQMAATLLDWGAGVNGPTNAAATPLSVAMHHGQYAVANRLLVRKADVNARNTNGSTALHLCFARTVSDNGVDDSLAQHREHVEKKVVPETMTFSEWVRSTNHLSLLRDFWRIGVSGPDTRPNRSTHHLQPVEHPVKYLLAAGADPRLTNAAGRTPLHLLALRRDMESQVHTSRLEVVVGLLAARGADLNARSAAGHTPLHLAIQAGAVKVVQGLLRQGADVALPAPDGSGVVSLALQHRDPFYFVTPIVESLLERGAPLGGRDTNGQTVLHQFTKFAHASRDVGFGWNPSITERLLRAGVDVNAQDSAGETAGLTHQIVEEAVRRRSR